MKKKALKYYLELPYTKVIKKIREKSFKGSIVELPGCNVFGDSEEEALMILEKAKAAWIKYLLQIGEEVPEPIETTELTMSGRVSLAKHI